MSCQQTNKNAFLNCVLVCCHVEFIEMKILSDKEFFIFF